MYVQLERLEFDFTRPDGHVEGFGVEVENVAAYGAFEDFEDGFFGHGFWCGWILFC